MVQLSLAANDDTTARLVLLQTARRFSSLLVI
jgi:hypothetical protein